MGVENSSNEMPEVIPTDPEASVKGSRYDSSLRLDTTPTSRVNWMGDEERRSAFDANLIIDTTPGTRPEYIAPLDNIIPPDSGTDSSPSANDQ